MRVIPAQTRTCVARLPRDTFREEVVIDLPRMSCRAIASSSLRLSGARISGAGRYLSPNSNAQSEALRCAESTE